MTANFLIGVPLMLAAATLSGAAAWTRVGAQEPEYVGNFAAIVNGRPVALERALVSNHLRFSLMGLGGGSMRFVIPGARSPVRFASSQRLSLLLRTASQDTDPLGAIDFLLMSPKKDTRIVKAAIFNPVGAPRSGLTERSVSFTVAKQGRLFFRLTPTAPLPPGEYLVQMKLGPMEAGNLSATHTGFAFGID